MRLCVLNSETKICENIVNANSEQDFILYKQGIELAPDHTGEIGWTWTGSNWNKNEPQITDEILAEKIRYKRNILLKKYIDVLNPLRWESYTQEQKDAWATYRQALLDVPQQEGFPNSVIWPTKPN